MSLISRLIGSDSTEEKLPVHQFIASMAEGRRGEATKVQIVTFWNLTSAEEAQMDQIWANLHGTGTKSINREELHDVLMLSERGIRNEAQVMTRLGLV